MCCGDDGSQLPSSGWKDFKEEIDKIISRDIILFYEEEISGWLEDCYWNEPSSYGHLEEFCFFFFF